ncbi:fibronectin type III domain-containing protein [Rhodohalobacter sp. 614A]|uniref:fibronectin type III domain-containing protein n=1 Tax=Rhodohalobacter sp. 614A TaxID=2908649 RepID=UPI001F1BFDD1|nr:hypothetical protein [Rhodohalobacter sp. 614A]
MSKFIGYLLLAIIISPCVSVAQSVVNENSLNILTRNDGSVYIIHNYTLPFSHGYHLYRKVDEADWERLTTEPFFPAQNGFQLEQAMGPEFELIQDELDRESPQRIFLMLRAQTETNAIINAAVPELAIALGRAYLDENISSGSQVSYRFEIVNDLERPTGETIEGSAPLVSESPAPPSNILGTNEGRRVTIDWQYPTQEDAPETRNVIRFKTFYRDTESNVTVDATDAIFVRTRDDTEHRKYITVPRLNREYEFWVEAVDISGQSIASESVVLRIEDNVPPPIITDVDASATEDYQSEIVWPVSTDLELAGYHVYMSRADEEEYTRLTEEILSPLQTAFVHESAEPGVQYRYAVTAIDQNGNEGELSNPAHVYIWDYRIPEPVTNVAAVFDTDLSALQLEWSPGEEYRALQTYQILRRQINPKSGDLYEQLNDEAHLENSLTDFGYGIDGFREGVSYEYGVVAVSKNGNRSDTSWVEIQIPDLTPPEPPTTLQAQIRSGERVQVAWNASSSGDVISYNVYRRDMNADSLRLLSENGKGDRYLLDRMVELDGEYIYSVTAVDSLGNESEAVSSEILNVHKIHPPVPSKNVQALFTDGQVLLQWQVIDPSQVAGFHIYRSDIATGMYELIGQASQDTTRFSHNGSTAGQWFKVFPVDGIGREARTARPVQAVTN